MIPTIRVLEIIDEKMASYDKGLALIAEDGDVLGKKEEITWRKKELLAIKGQVLRENELRKNDFDQIEGLRKEGENRK